MRVSILASCLVLMASALPAAAQNGSPPTTADTALVDELIVRAYGGPAWWKVSDGDTVVYVLPVLGALPKGTPLDRSGLEKRLTGANQLILPMAGYDPKPSPKDLLVILRYRLGMGMKKPTLEPGLPPGLRTRFAVLREKIKQPEQRYGTLPAGAAAMLLAGDTLTSWNPPQKGPPYDAVMPQILAVAKARKVKTETPRYTGPRLGYNRLISDLFKPDVSCLAAIVADLEKGPPPPPAAAIPYADVARAWADGDVRPLLREAARGERLPPALQLEAQGYRLFIPPGAWPTCTAQMPNTNADIFKVSPVADTTGAIQRALRTPGHAVAIAGAYELLKKDGVLDRLRKQGFTVTAPGGAD